MKALATGAGICWTLCLGGIAIFGFFAALGAFDPGEVMWLTVTVGAVGVLSMVHFVRVRHALDSGRDKELARAIHAMREQRGF